MKNNFLPRLLMIGSVITTLITSCSKSDPNPGSPTDPCAGKTINVSATVTAASPCTADGSINITATGSTGFTYKVNAAGTYQASQNFTGIAPGTYTVFAKDAGGCEKSASVTVTNAGAAGPQFTAMKNLISTRCQSCHNSAQANGGVSFSNECNIILKQDRIKVRAVDEGTMPQAGPLSASDKAIITNWINGGGGYGN